MNRNPHWLGWMLILSGAVILSAIGTVFYLILRAAGLV